MFIVGSVSKKKTIEKEFNLFFWKKKSKNKNCPKGIGQKSPIRGYDS